ncbi:hypothetical protein J2046_000857 [Rhizobium petrolearium]|nr:hypothetical protein [Neorhizobium petrolearium]
MAVPPLGSGGGMILMASEKLCQIGAKMDEISKGMRKQGPRFLAIRHASR